MQHCRDFRNKSDILEYFMYDGDNISTQWENDGLFQE